MKRFLMVLMVTGVVAGAVLPLPGASAAALVDGAARAGCNGSDSISVRPVAAGAYVVRVQGSGDCPGATTVTACILMQLPAGGYQPVTCGSGVSTGRASVSVETACVPGQRYRGQVTFAGDTTVEEHLTGSVTCPPAATSSRGSTW
ncbi:MAG TPA: hypothetical protein VIG64_09730 [Actinomycetota bacterium]